MIGKNNIAGENAVVIAVVITGAEAYDDTSGIFYVQLFFSLENPLRQLFPIYFDRMHPEMLHIK